MTSARNSDRATVGYIVSNIKSVEEIKGGASRQQKRERFQQRIETSAQARCSEEHELN